MFFWYGFAKTVHGQNIVEGGTRNWCKHHLVLLKGLKQRKVYSDTFFSFAKGQKFAALVLGAELDTVGVVSTTVTRWSLLSILLSSDVFFLLSLYECEANCKRTREITEVLPETNESSVLLYIPAANETTLDTPTNILERSSNERPIRLKYLRRANVFFTSYMYVGSICSSMMIRFVFSEISRPFSI